MRHPLQQRLTRHRQAEKFRKLWALLLITGLSIAGNQPTSAEVFNETDAHLPLDFQTYVDSLVSYYSAGINEGDFDIKHLEVVASLYDRNIDIDLAAVHECLQSTSHTITEAIRQTAGHYATSFVVSKLNLRKKGIQEIWYAQSHISSGGALDQSEFGALYISKEGIIGNTALPGEQENPCWEENTQRSAEVSALYLKAKDSSSLSPTEAGRKSEAGSVQNPDDNDEPIGSTGSNKWDLITTDDPSVLECVVYHGRGHGEIFDKRIDEAVVHQDAFLFTAYYRDGTDVAIRLHPEFNTEEAAIEEVKRYTVRMGQLPTILRENILRLAVMKGDNTAMGDGDGEGIHIQSGNAQLRESNNRLEETLFHEAVHTSLDDIHAVSPIWQSAQITDKRFLTTYGRKKPAREDFAESMLYVFALLHNKDRIPVEYRELISNRVPNRIKYIENLLPAGQSIFTRTDISNESCQTK